MLIIDNISPLIITALRVGFSKPFYMINESVNGIWSEVTLSKEDGRITEQTFIVEISSTYISTDFPSIQLNDSTSFIKGGDYAFTNGSSALLVVIFPPHLQELPIDLTIYDDEIVEGREAFVLRSMSSNNNGAPNYNFPINTTTETTIVIQDDDCE